MRPKRIRLDERIRIERVTEASDGMGGVTQTWSELATVWASVAGVGGRETWATMRTTGKGQFRAVIRWREDEYGQPYYTNLDRVIWRGRTYAIQAVMPLGGRQGMDRAGASGRVAVMRVKMRVSDASNVLGKLQRMSEQGPQAVDATVRVLAERIVEEAVGNMPKGGVSAPGEAPHQQSGELAQSIKSIVRRRGEKTKGKVGTSPR